MANSNKKYLIVMHTWFQESIRFRRKIVSALSLREAKKEAALWKVECESLFERCATTVVELENLPQEYVEGIF